MDKHKQFFWICAIGKKDEGLKKCNFVQSAEQKPKSKPAIALEKLYNKVITQRVGEPFTPLSRKRKS